MTDILAVVTIGDRYKVWRLVPGCWLLVLGAWCLVIGVKGPKSSRERRAAKKGK